MRRSSVAATALGMGGLIHLALAPGHLGVAGGDPHGHVQSTASLGVGFALCGALGIFLAAALTRRPSRAVWVAAGALSAVMAGAYATSRTSGLLGEGREPVDSLGLITVLAELAVVMMAVRAVPLSLGRVAVAVAMASTLIAAGAVPATAARRATVPPPFQLPLRIPPTLVPTSPDGVTDVYTLTAAPATTRMIPGKDTPVWAINGVVPAPTIRARAGRPVQVNLTNNLPETTNIHNHGMFTRPEFDGLPMQQIATGGGTYTYRYPNAQSARTLWYHDHVMDKTGPHVYKGLAGFYLISDPNEDSLGLPSGADEVPLLIQDKTFNSDGSLSYPLSASTITSGVLGKVIVVNGVQQPFFPVAPHKLRLRLLNGSDARQYTLALSNGQPLIQIGSEGGLLPAPISKSSIVLGPAERADVLVDLSGLGGTSVVLNNTAGSGGVGAVMRFDVQTATPVTSTTPSTLAPFTPIPPSDATVTRTFTLSQSSGVWVINGKAFDPNRVDVPVAFGTTEIWSFTNNSSQRHLLHLHDVTFQILDINGSPPPTGKRTNTEMVNIPPVGRARIIVHFGNDHGTYVFHCHVLAHEDHAMMAQFNVS